MPDRVNHENMLFVVQEHQRRLDRLEQHTEDLGVVRRDVDVCRTTTEAVRGDIRSMRHELDAELITQRKDLDELRGTLVKASVSVSTTLLVFAATIFAVFK
jgi:hypothetical protein